MGINNNNSDKNISEEEKICLSLFEFVEHLFFKDVNKESFDTNSIKDRLDIDVLYGMIKKIMQNVRDNHCNLMLALMDGKYPKNNNYIYYHTVRTTIIALIIGNQLKMPTHKLVELGVAALLHDIGMIMIPEQLYLRSGPLTKEEKQTIKNHPVYGYKLLEPYSLPPAIKLAVLEHHEREDGAGYPQKTAKKAISQYGKIVALACSYEASSSKRVYKESFDLHAGLIDILKCKGKYCNTVVQALVNSLSVYPVGLYVLMSNGKRGRVIDVDPLDPRFPIVALLGEKNSEGKDAVQNTFSNGLYIVRPLQKDE